MVLVMDYLPKNKKLDSIFVDMVVPNTIGRVQVGDFDLVIGIRKDFPNFRFPVSDEAQRQHSIKFWSQEYLKK